MEELLQQSALKIWSKNIKDIKKQLKILLIIELKCVL